MARNRSDDRLSPPLDGTWPGDRDPGRLDAEKAHDPLKTTFVASFKRELLADEAIPNAIQFFETAAQSPLNTTSESEHGVRNP
jgi:hypothetical protein